MAGVTDNTKAYVNENLLSIFFLAESVQRERLYILSDALDCNVAYIDDNFFLRNFVVEKLYH